TQEEIDNGVEVICVEKGGKDDKNADQVRHAYDVDADGNRFDVEPKPNDCFYRAFSKILERQKGIKKSIQDIRNELADDIETNGNYSKVMEAEKWIHDQHPQEANSLLFSAGRKLSIPASFGKKHIAKNLRVKPQATPQPQSSGENMPFELQSQSSSENNDQTDDRYIADRRQVKINTIIQETEESLMHKIKEAV
ncbi:unnamed protein product, partial [Didymodactylos carnosus]